MPDGAAFHTQTALAKGLHDLFTQLEQRLSLSKTLTLESSVDGLNRYVSKHCARTCRSG
jgi:hypothetical protein